LSLDTSSPAGTAGTSGSAALCAGGLISPNTGTAVVEVYDGSSWTEEADLSTGRNQHPQFGTQTASVVCGGGPFGAYLTTVEEWNGASWSTGTSLSTGRTQASGFGISTAGMCATGTTTGSNYGITTCEEWAKAVSTQTVTHS